MRADHRDPQVTHRILDFSDLDGWEDDNHAAALKVFTETCADMTEPDWRNICAVAQSLRREEAKSFFQLFFRPVEITRNQPALFTGYYEPELTGSRHPDARFRYPLYAMPPEARGGPWLTRREILTSGVMDNRGLEIAWVDDPVELFFLQIQGSGRIRLREGGSIRVGYGGANGQPYRSVGEELVRRGVYSPHQVSAKVIGNWVRRNPEEGQELLFHNPSYVFFRKLDDMPDGRGPLGAMNRSLTPMRSIAVDPAYTPLGAPVWLEADGAVPMRRLMVAQDTGSVIRGAQRADIFTGSGAAAGRMAGRMRDTGRMVVLMPIQRAYALLPGDI
ncbi:murein transglycosylase A [Chachezhania sediminis]|uniref:murein transglycosylase A n=1 Tax=Chachezhania sediminis TaxID=2599291 RepID=UPI001E395E97|nr:MltA domain-containing protein [Chachezhania sediminis]